MTNVGLGLLLGAVLAADTAVVAARPGDGNWPFELAVGLIIGVVALLRGRGRVLAATAGLAVCLAADVAGDAARLPSQPGVAATLGLLVLGAAAVRVAAARPAAVVAVAGAVVLVAGRAGVRHEYILPLAFLGLLAWGGALGMGAWLRFVDARHQLAVDAARRDERLELARELHDVVAHHVAGIVVQAQAARLVAARRPETLEPTLAGIESAGTDALDAMRRVVGLLRDDGDAGVIAHGPEELAGLVARFSDRGPAVRLRLPDGGQAAWPPEVATHRLPGRPGGPDQRRPARAGGGQVTVTVEDGPSGVTVEVVDDAPAGRPAPSWFGRGGYGLAGMRERVEALGGSLQRRVGPGGRLGGAGRRSRAGRERPVSIRVLLADDQAMIRGGLRLILEDQPDITVVGEAADGAEAIALARRLRPDVCLVDIRMPGRDGLEVTRALAGPGVPDPLRVVIVTTFDLDEYVYGALRAGAVGFLLKGTSPALLVEAVRAARAGDGLISPQVTIRLLRHLTPPRRAAARRAAVRSANSRSRRPSPRVAPTPRSRPSCSSRSAPSSPTSPASRASSTSVTGWRSPPGPGVPASSSRPSTDGGTVLTRSGLDDWFESSLSRDTYRKLSLDRYLSRDYYRDMSSDDAPTTPQRTPDGTPDERQLRKITDARTLRALAHPVRIALFEELALGGAMTATQIGERIGESATTCSFHLRQLAKYGFVEEAGGGTGRSRPWRLTSIGMSFSPSGDTEAEIASDAVARMFRERQFERYQAWRSTKASYPLEWRQAADRRPVPVLPHRAGASAAQQRGARTAPTLGHARGTAPGPVQAPGRLAAGGGDGARAPGRAAWRPTAIPAIPTMPRLTAPLPISVALALVVRHWGPTPCFLIAAATLAVAILAGLSLRPWREFGASQAGHAGIGNSPGRTTRMNPLLANDLATCHQRDLRHLGEQRRRATPTTANRGTAGLRRAAGLRCAARSASAWSRRGCT